MISAFFFGLTNISVCLMLLLLDASISRRSSSFSLPVSIELGICGPLFENRSLSSEMLDRTFVILVFFCKILRYAGQMICLCLLVGSNSSVRQYVEISLRVVHPLYVL